MLAQLFQQHLVSGFKAAQVDLLVFDHRRIQHAAHQPFGQRIRHANIKEQVRLFAVVDDIQHLLAKGKHFVRVAENQLTQLAGFNPAPLTLEQLALQTFFQRLDLPGDGLRRQVERLCSPDHRALSIDVPEVVKMVVIQMRHRVFAP